MGICQHYARKSWDFTRSPVGDHIRNGVQKAVSHRGHNDSEASMARSKLPQSPVELIARLRENPKVLGILRYGSKTSLVGKIGGHLDLYYPGRFGDFGLRCEERAKFPTTATIVQSLNL